ncbi:MAG: hypothetical protein MHMPM18_000552 [Marteilia pararefringens]
METSGQQESEYLEFLNSSDDYFCLSEYEFDRIKKSDEEKNCHKLISYITKYEKEMEIECGEDSIMKLQFDPFLKTTDELISYCFIILKKNEMIKRNNINEKAMVKFLISVKDNYLSTPQYHNFVHGFLVFQFANYFLHESNLIEIIDPRWSLIILIVSLGHDLGHPGICNRTLMFLKDPLCFRHNSVSPLENYHADKLINLLFSDPNSKLFTELPEWENNAIQNDIRELIIATDMTNHRKILDNFSIFMNEENLKNDLNSIICRKRSEALITDRKGLMEVSKMILKLSDVSNEFRSFKIFKKIYINLICEFKSQYYFEESLGFIHSCDLSKLELFQFQQSFVENCILPILNNLLLVFPEMKFLRTKLKKNLKNFESEFKNVSGSDRMFSSTISKFNSESFHRGSQL